MAEAALSRADAQVLEAAEAAHLAGQARLAAVMDPSTAARTLPLDGGVAVLSVPAFGRKLNHAVGLGMAGPTDLRQLGAIEAAFDAQKTPVEIDLCPLTHPSTLGILAERGYVGSAFSNTYWGRPRPAGDLVTGVSIRRAEPEDAGEFIAAQAAGFGATPNPRSNRLLDLLARGALARSDVTPMIAEIDGRIAGTASIAIVEVLGQRVAHLFGASTVEAFRGRGVQPALLAVRLAIASDIGADWVSLCARPLNVSARNAERAGLRLAYTKTTFVRRAASHISDNIS